MHRLLSLGLAMLAGAALGVMAIEGLRAQVKPPTYIVVDIEDVIDPAGFDPIITGPATSVARTAELGGRYIIRTGTTTPLVGPAPERFVVLAFDSKEKAQSWSDSPEIKDVTALRGRTTKSRAFIVEGFAN